MDLVIVESPAKAKTISHFLQKNFKVVASYGHIRDLPKSKLGIDIENNFEPHYIIPIKQRKNFSQLRKEVKKAKTVILATDEDREGEAIAYHLIEAFNLKQIKGGETEDNKNNIQRIAFHEITKPAIEQALKNPRKINMALVNAQQARRILDRLVGYELSPFLWKKILRGLSAGRVQSPALRLIVEREREREVFKIEEYYSLSALFKKLKLQEEIKGNLVKINNQLIPAPGIKTKKEAEEIKKDIENKEGEISEIKISPMKRSPNAPFTTSTLQQTAWQAFRFPVKKTMQIAQGLYEGKDLGEGPVGLITYMRTDSFNISPLALKSAYDFLIKNFGENYALEKPRIFKSKSKLSQEAHEAVRPTNPFYLPEKIKNCLSSDEFKLYQLIWSRFIASQMPEAKMEKTSLLLEVKGGQNEYLFQSNFYRLIFDGFLRIYSYQKMPEFTKNIPSLSLKEKLEIKEITINQHFTQPPPHFNDASLVKALESFGIGRPSTYAPIISVLQERGYISRDKNKAFIPTEMGILVNGVLTKHFPNIVDYHFTSQMETKLDEIARGELVWQETVKSFYGPFKENLENKYHEVSKEDLAPITPMNKNCPLCNKNLVIRWGRFGKFISCSDWPNCSYTESINNNLDEESDIACPKCQEGKVVAKRNKKGKMFYACKRWPDCDFTSSFKPSPHSKKKRPTNENNDEDNEETNI